MCVIHMYTFPERLIGLVRHVNHYFYGITLLRKVIIIQTRVAVLLQELMGVHENLDAYLRNLQNLFVLLDNVHVPLTRKPGLWTNWSQSTIQKEKNNYWKGKD